MIRTFMRNFIYQHITWSIERYNLTYTCDLWKRSIRVEEVLIQTLSTNFKDYYDPNSLIERIELSIRVACINNITKRHMERISNEYSLTKEKHEKIFYLHKIRSLVLIMWENRIRQNDIQGSNLSKSDYISFSKAICKEFEDVKKIK